MSQRPDYPQPSLDYLHLGDTQPPESTLRELLDQHRGLQQADFNPITMGAVALIESSIYIDLATSVEPSEAASLLAEVDERTDFVQSNAVKSGVLSARQFLEAGIIKSFIPKYNKVLVAGEQPDRTDDQKLHDSLLDLIADTHLSELRAANSSNEHGLAMAPVDYNSNPAMWGLLVHVLSLRYNLQSDKSLLLQTWPALARQVKHWRAAASRDGFLAPEHLKVHVRSTTKAPHPLLSVLPGLRVVNLTRSMSAGGIDSLQRLLLQTQKLEKKQQSEGLSDSAQRTLHDNNKRLDHMEGRLLASLGYNDSPTMSETEQSSQVPQAKATGTRLKANETLPKPPKSKYDLDTHLSLGDSDLSPDELSDLLKRHDRTSFKLECKAAFVRAMIAIDLARISPDLDQVAQALKQAKQSLLFVHESATTAPQARQEHRLKSGMWLAFLPNHYSALVQGPAPDADRNRKLLQRLFDVASDPYLDDEASFPTPGDNINNIGLTWREIVTHMLVARHNQQQDSKKMSRWTWPALPRYYNGYRPNDGGDYPYWNLGTSTSGFLAPDYGRVQLRNTAYESDFLQKSGIVEIPFRELRYGSSDGLLGRLLYLRNHQGRGLEAFSNATSVLHNTTAAIIDKMDTGSELSLPEKV